MTKGQEKSSSIKMKLYRATLTASHTDADIAKYKHHQNLYNKLKCIAREDYYRTKCVQFKENSKKLWSLINNTIKKVKHKGSIIPYIMVNGIKKTCPKEITDSFGNFYATLGSSLVSKIVPGTTSIDDYLQHIPHQLNSLVKQTTPLGIDKIIKALPNKSSHGHDQIDNIMLKSLRTSITLPLCHIFNQSIYKSSFPDLMKRAEVIPLYEGKEIDYMINYKPISLLITLPNYLKK